MTELLLKQGTGKKNPVGKTEGEGLYFDCPFRAAYMMKEFGVRIYAPASKEVEEFEYELHDLMMFDIGDGGSKYYIHPLHYKMFTPHPDDLWLNAKEEDMTTYEFKAMVIASNYKHAVTWATPSCRNRVKLIKKRPICENEESEYHYFIKNGGRCFVRNGKVFFWPKGDVTLIAKETAGNTEPPFTWSRDKRIVAG